ncbi:MAG TPA: PLP-dependent aminotransferase family protein [Chloroflexota bacterium]|jgi:2-aminoadipate transaminase|nr:PLP-dependent aminotransferase family protein [Chloroflexota bacterium]
MSATTAVDFRALLSTRARIGQAVRGTIASSTRAVQTPLYEFGGGRPDPGSFPYDGLVEATARMIKEEGADALSYGDPLGYAGLRDLVCHKYDLFEGLKVERENILIANGSSHALSLAVSAFVDTGDAIIVEAPTFSGTLSMIRRHGPEILDAPVDEEGLVTGVVRERLESLKRQGRRCKLIYTIVNFQNPSGPTMSLRRRRELVALAHAYGTLILEDDAYGELRFEGEPQPSLYALDGGAVIRSGTLSKILGAGTRLGWLCAPKEMIPYLASFNFGGGVNPFMSRVAVHYMRQHMAEHVKLLIDVYRDKRDAMRRGLLELLDGTDAVVNKPEGGFFLWVKLPSGTNRQKLAELAAGAGVQYVPGPSFYPNGGGEEYIRLAYSYESAEKCRQGARLLAEAILSARLSS